MSSMDTSGPRRSGRVSTAPLGSPSISDLLTQFKGGVKRKKEEGEDDKDMACNATLTGNGQDYAGAYDSGTGQHAEMNAISAFIAAGGDLTKVTKIVISSPPCTACALILSAFGLSGVVEAGKTYKHFTSAWRLPDNMRNKALITNTSTLGLIRLCYKVTAADASSDDRIFARFWDDIGKKLD